MNVQLQGNEQITKLFNDWYLAMLKQDVSQATNLKHEIEEKELNFEEDENLALYYSLLNFRFKVLTDGLSITKDSFNKIDSYVISPNHQLSYYYHLFKAIHATLTTNYNLAGEHYEHAEKLLVNVSDKLEEAEYNYRFAIFNQHFINRLMQFNMLIKLEKYFSCIEIMKNVASCESVIGASCVQLRQYEQAEEHYNSAINILQNKMKNLYFKSS